MYKSEPGVAVNKGLVLFLFSTILYPRLRQGTMERTKLTSIELHPRALSQSGEEDVPLHASPDGNGTSSRLKFRCLGAKGTVEKWKKTLYMGCMATLVVLGFNLGFMLWAVTHLGLEGGRGVLFSGACDQTKKISTGFHLLINLLGTTMLAAGNYGMVCS